MIVQSIKMVGGSLNNFFEYKQDKEYKYKILVYPNITYMKT